MAYRPETRVDKVGDATHVVCRRVNKDLERFEDENAESGVWRGRSQQRRVRDTTTG